MWLWASSNIQSGRFAPIFYDAYREAREIEPGYSQRRDLYNLYHLLIHLNLFGRSLLWSCNEDYHALLKGDQDAVYQFKSKYQDDERAAEGTENTSGTGDIHHSGEKRILAYGEPGR
jgi:hypothetical protein